MALFHQGYQALKRGYAPRFARHLDELFASTVEVLGLTNIKGILLVGSTARHELSVHGDGDDLDIHSDVEYVVVTHRPVPSHVRAQLRERNAKATADLGIKSPLFSVDCVLVTARRWRWRPATLFTFEARELGVVVLGEDVRTRMPRVSIGNLDHGSVNTLILVRLWNALLHTPKSYLSGCATPYEEFLAKFVYSRNILDLLTIYLPTRGILKAGYRARAMAFNDLASNLFGEEEIRTINAAHRLKLDGVDELDAEAAKEVFFAGYLKVLAHVSRIEPWDRSPDTLAAFVAAVASSDPFSERPLTKAGRITREMRIFGEYIRRGPTLERVGWLFRDKRYQVLGALLSLHAISSGGHTKMERVMFRRSAVYYLERLTAQRINLAASEMSASVHELRRKLALFMMRWRNASTRMVTESELLAAMNFHERAASP